MAADPGLSTERRDGPTPAGGASTVIHYQDAAGAPATRGAARAAEVIEFDDAGRVIARTYAILGRPEPRP